MVSIGIIDFYKDIIYAFYFPHHNAITTLPLWFSITAPIGIIYIFLNKDDKKPTSLKKTLLIFFGIDVFFQSFNKLTEDELDKIMEEVTMQYQKEHKWKCLNDSDSTVVNGDDTPDEDVRAHI